jgi:hypothetical protein
MLQRIYIQQAGTNKVFIPSKDMVIVRLGLTDESQFDINEVLKVVLKVAFNQGNTRISQVHKNFVLIQCKGEIK